MVYQTILNAVIHLLCLPENKKSLKRRDASKEFQSQKRSAKFLFGKLFCRVRIERQSRLFMRNKRAGDQTDSSGEQREHYYCVKKACRLKINLQIRDDASENNDDAGKGQQPADD